jgi:glycosyltransferase involved in cell wall biosynthesis
MSITAAMIVYNEEKRIEDTLHCVQWCDEILVFDRMSTDNTRKVALQYSARIIDVPNREFNPKDNLLILEYASSEWILGITASDLITTGLANKIRKLTDQKDFPYDIIHVPFRRYVLGIETKRSPWYCETFPSVYRKQVMRVNPNSVHCAVFFDSNRYFKIPNSKEDCLFHLTHESLNVMMDRHLNYWNTEARAFPNDKSFWGAIKPVFGSLKRVLVQRKTFLMGWNGIALMLAYLSYSMLAFVYIWEKRRGNAHQIYAELKRKVLKEWGKQPKTNE